MIKIQYLMILVFLSFSLPAFPQISENIVKGIVTNNGEPVPYVNVRLYGTVIGVLTDEQGSFQIGRVPTGNQKLVFSSIGYKSTVKEIMVEKGREAILQVAMENDVFGLEAVVVTANRNAQSRSESPVVVQNLLPEMFDNTQSISVSEGLNYCTGLRMEDNCSNCGFTQLRMNGLEGPYTQILINSRPIFSGLAGVYGLEMIPLNMIEKIEVVRGGGSALYGSNAIAGTVNLILVDPYFNNYEAGITNSWVGIGYDKPAYDQSINFNATLVSKDYKSGFSLYGFHRNRAYLDVNGDDFSELPQLNNTTLGARYNQRLSKTAKLTLDFFSINEDRRGGNRFDYPLHQADVAEAVSHKISTAAVVFEQILRKSDLLSIYASGQGVRRNSYYGANRSLSDYGFTKDQTFAGGIQHRFVHNQINITTGVEYSSDHLEDTKLGYPILSAADSSVIDIDNTLIANQLMRTLGAYVQLEMSYLKWKMTLGGRYDNYLVENLAENLALKKGMVLSPSITLMYELKHNLKLRASLSRAYRAPQIFDEDLHINTSGSRQVLYRNDPNLVAEKSMSSMLSLDYNFKVRSMHFNFLAEAFYTVLQNPFANEFGAADANGVVVYTRINAESGAHVAGLNLETNWIPNNTLQISIGGTIQQSQYEEAQVFNEKNFFRSPNTYSYLTFDYDMNKRWELNVSGTYTGAMLVPYFGPQIADSEAGELRISKPFFDLGLKLQYQLHFGEVDVQLFGGVKNVFNSFQNDFDLGIDKDPAYIYGPAKPRTIYVGLKLGNMI
jgi:outer membrane receptor for ferrienterochelin and colicins